MIIFLKTGSSIYYDTLSVVLPVILTVVFYSVYWFLAVSQKIKGRLSGLFISDSGGLAYTVIKRLIGFFLLGVMPLAIFLLLSAEYTMADAGLGFNPEKSGFTVISILFLSLLIIPVISRNARKPEIMAIYPEIRASQWTGGLMAVEALTWALYLLGYETLFRGILLFGLAESLGPLIATAVNVILYSAAHIPKSRAETLAAIPFGIVLCILTLESGSIWIAFIAHLVNAVTLSIAAIRHNPDMSYAGERR